MFLPQWNPHHPRSLGWHPMPKCSHQNVFFFKLFTLVPHPGTKLLKYSFNIHQPSSNTGLTSKHFNEKCFTHFSFLRSCNQMHKLHFNDKCFIKHFSTSTLPILQSDARRTPTSVHWTHVCPRICERWIVCRMLSPVGTSPVAWLITFTVLFFNILESKMHSESCVQCTVVLKLCNGPIFDEKPKPFFWQQCSPNSELRSVYHGKLCYII